MSHTVLITGGLGYLGGRMTRYLSENSASRMLAATRREGMRPPLWLKDGGIIRLDVTAPRISPELFRGVQGVVHLAAINEIQCREDPHAAMEVNSVGTLKVLAAAQEAGVKRFIYLSTAHVYGAPLQGTITEQTLPRPVHPYAISHRVAEDMVLAAHDQKLLTGIVLRLSNALGPPVQPEVDRWTLLVNNLCRQAATTGELLLRSTGKQVRDFVTLLDVCRAVDHLLNLPAENCADSLFNLGGQCAMTIIEMARRIADRCQEVLGVKPQIQLPPSAQEQASNDLDYRIDKLKSTGFELRGNIDAEIDDTLLFCREALGLAK